MVLAQGQIWWADLPVPIGSAPGYRRPMVVVQGDAFNRSNIGTVVCVPLTTNLRWANVRGNVLLAASLTGLPRDSVALVSQIMTVDRAQLTDLAGETTNEQLQLIMAGIDLVLGRRRRTIGG